MLGTSVAFIDNKGLSLGLKDGSVEMDSSTNGQEQGFAERDGAVLGTVEGDTDKDG